jgi:DNA-binding NarL/FixJ family response regulator
MQATITPFFGIIFLTSFNDERFIFNFKKEIPKNYAYLRKQEISNVKIVSDAIIDLARFSEKSDNTSNLKKKYYVDLSDRDIELMRYVSQGYSNAKIANLLNIGEKSCENAISRLLKKLSIPADKEINQRVLITRKYFELSGKEIF